jgi:hypothetical protein
MAQVWELLLNVSKLLKTSINKALYIGKSSIS